MANHVEILPDTDLTTVFKSLKKKKVNLIPTSYVAESEGVQKYIMAMEEDGNPRAAYEFTQNQWDYNNDAIGHPEIWLVDDQNNRMPYPVFARMGDGEIFEIAKKVKKVEFVNNIIPGQGMMPEDVLFERHGGGEGTLGAHGRGGKVGGTAIVAGGHASSIEYVSVDENGPWRGETAMVINRQTFPDQKTPSYALGYERLDEKDESVDKTVVTIHDPSVTFLACFKKLSDYFLPTNSRYENYRFNHSKELQPMKNLFTANVLADSQKPEGTNNVNFSGADKEHFNIPEIKHREAPRVEILPWDIVESEGSDLRTDQMFVDGLRLESSSRYYANRWSFWGFSKADHGYKIERSTNSDYINGDPEKLMALTLSKCDNPEVFHRIFEASLNNQRCGEAMIPYEIFATEIKKNKKAVAAMEQAWLDFCAVRNLDPKTVLLTSDERSVQKAKRKSITPIHMNSTTFVKTLHELEICKELEQTIDLPVDPRRSGEVFNDFVDPEQRSEIIIDDILEALVKSKARMDINGNVITMSLPFSNSHQDSGFALYGSAIKSTRNLFRLLMATRLWKKFGLDVARSMNIDGGLPGEEGFLEVSEVPETSSEEGMVTVRPIFVPSKTRGNSGINIQIRSRTVNRGYEVFKEELERRFSKVATEGRVDEKKWIDSAPDRLANMERMIKMKEDQMRETLERREQELEDVNSRLEDARRMLGQIEEDKISDSPTREDLIPSVSSDYRQNGRGGITRKYTTLRDPNMAIYARNSVFSNVASSPQSVDQKIRSTDDAKAYIKNTLESLQEPDIQLIRPDLVPGNVRDTLICGVNTILSNPIDYSHNLGLQSQRTITQAGVKITHNVVVGTHVAPVFVNSRITGFYHPNPIVARQIEIKESSTLGLYVFSSKMDVPPGLEFYYEYDTNHKSRMIPGDSEKAVLGRKDLLRRHWQELIDTTNSYTPPLTEKQKLDIAMTAWLHAFNYDDHRDVDKIFADLPMEERFSEIINNSSGNCGYTAEGFAVLCRFFGLPSIKLNGYLGKMGRYFPGPQNHALDAVFIDGEWVVVEPQLGYLSAGYKREEIPDVFTDLIKRIPEGRNIFPENEQASSFVGVDGLVRKLKELDIKLDAETIAMIRKIQDINEDDQRVFSYSSIDDEPAIPLTNAITSKNDEALDKIVETNRDKKEKYTIADKHADEFVMNLLHQAKQLGLEVDMSTTPEELLTMIENALVEKQEAEKAAEDKKIKKKRRTVAVVGTAAIVTYLAASGSLSGLEAVGHEIMEKLLSFNINPSSTPLPAPVSTPQPPAVEAIDVPQTIDTLKLNMEIIKIIAMSLLTSGATKVYDAIHYNRIINRLKKHEKQPK